jgi:hypothetical protein
VAVIFQAEDFRLLASPVRASLAAALGMRTGPPEPRGALTLGAFFGNLRVEAGELAE